MKKYVVALTTDESSAIDALRQKGRIAVRKLMRANILRLAHEQYTDEEIADSLQTSIATIERARAKFVIGGLEWALQEDPRPGAPHKLDGKQEAFLVALACSEPPTGAHCWTMQLLADNLLTLKVIAQAVSDETVRRALKKTNSSRGSERNGVSPPSARNLSGAWKMCSTSMPSRIIRAFRWSVSMSAPIN